MRHAPHAWSHLTDDAIRRYVAFALETLPALAERRLPWWRRAGPLARNAALRAGLRAAIDLPGLGFEFGVYRGHTLRFAARAQKARQFLGFDSFTGFPEDDGRPDWQLDFATAALPAVPANVTLYPGWFADTLPRALAEHDGPAAFVHVDCDLYSSARTALSGVAGRVEAGTVLCFDELLNYDTHPWNELLALHEFLDETGWGIEWIATAARVRPFDVTLPLLAAGIYPAWEADVAAGFARPAAGRLVPRDGPLGDLSDPRVEPLAETFADLTRRLRRGVLVQRHCPPDQEPPASTAVGGA